MERSGYKSFSWQTKWIFIKCVSLSELSFTKCFFLIYSAASSLTSEVKISVDANEAAENPKTVADQITEAFKNNTKFNLTDANDFRASGEFIITIPKFAGKRN